MNPRQIHPASLHPHHLHGAPQQVMFEMEQVRRWGLIKTKGGMKFFLVFFLLPCLWHKLTQIWYFICMDKQEVMEGLGRSWVQI